jgi:hypothetical protein
MMRPALTHGGLQLPDDLRDLGLGSPWVWNGSSALPSRLNKSPIVFRFAVDENMIGAGNVLRDYGPRRYDLNLENGSAAVRQSDRGPALYLDGSSNFVTPGDLFVDDQSGNDKYYFLAFSCWFQSFETGGTQRGLFEQSATVNASSSTDAFVVNRTASNVLSYLKSSYRDGTTTIIPYRWYHACFAWRHTYGGFANCTSHIFLDGVQESTSTGLYSLYTATREGRIGSGYSTYFHGLMRDIVMIQHPITDEQVRWLARPQRHPIVSVITDGGVPAAESWIWARQHTSHVVGGGM